MTFFFIVILFVFGFIYFYVGGISLFSNFIVDRLPKDIDKELGAEVRRKILKNAEIDEAKSVALNQFYTALRLDSETKLYVLKGEEFNAFALPDNSIFVFDAMLNEMHNYPELVALLGHEYAHIKFRHGMKSVAQNISRQLFIELIRGGDQSEPFLQQSATFLDLKNSRAFETASDNESLQFLINNRIDPNGLIRLFKTIQLQEKENEFVPGYLSTHPATEERIKEVEEKLKGTKTTVVRRPELERIFFEIKK